jgi:hypothetical protein
MKTFCKFYKFWPILLQTIYAVNMVAVLELTPASDDVSLTVSEFRFLTDELRAQARKVLPKDYTILTRENILQLLPSDEAETECLIDTGCAVNIGRAIGAEYVTQGRIGNFDGMLMLTVELYESMSGNMLSSFVADSENIRGLLQAVREKAAPLFEKLSEPRFSGLKDSQDTLQDTLQVSIPQTIVPSTQAIIPVSQTQIKTSAWMAIGLDVLGIAALGFGISQHFTADKHYKDYKKNGKSKEEYDSIYEDVKEAKINRNILYAAGSVLLISGIMVHIWF